VTSRFYPMRTGGGRAASGSSRRGMEHQGPQQDRLYPRRGLALTSARVPGAPTTYLSAVRCAGHELGTEVRRRLLSGVSAHRHAGVDGHECADREQWHESGPDSEPEENADRRSHADGNKPVPDAEPAGVCKLPGLRPPGDQLLFGPVGLGPESFARVRHTIQDSFGRPSNPRSRGPHRTGVRAPGPPVALILFCSIAEGTPLAATTRRMATALMLCLMIGLTACSHSNRASTHTDEISLSPSATPPDPCALLTDADMSEAVGMPMRQSVKATPPLSPLGQRICWWVAKSGNADAVLTITTNSALAIADPGTTAASLLDDSNGTPVPGTASQAKAATLPDGFAKLEVAGPSTYFELDFDRLPSVSPSTTSAQVTLIRQAITRLPPAIQATTTTN
jgi:hypothetical protein